MMRTADLTLARVHLRLGCLALARAELEALAGRDGLDDAGMVDLAEARWRTGDIAGAGDVAAAVLGDGDDGPLITLVVAAEASLARGRPTEARRYSTKAMEAADGRIDDVFAGMPRGPVWPTDSTTLHLPPPTLFDVPAVELAAVPGLPTGRDTTADPTTTIDDPGGPELPGAHQPDTIAFWEADGPATDAADVALAGASTESAPDPAQASREPAGPTPAPTPPGPAHAPDSGPDEEAGGDSFLMGAEALDRGDVQRAAVQLALALRLSPALAPSILEVIDRRTDRELAFVRGDAYRLVGREADARRAYADAVDHSDDPTDNAPEGDPA